MKEFVSKSQINFYSKLRPTYTEEIKKRVLQNVKGNGKYLDVACGSGQLFNRIASDFEYSMGIDISQTQIDALKKVNTLSNADIDCVSAYDIEEYAENKLGSAEKQFDLITIGQAYHWFEEEKLNKGLASVLKDEGKLVIVNYGKNHIDSSSPLFERTDEFVKTLLPFFEFDIANHEDAYPKNAFPFFKRGETVFFKEEYTATVRDFIDFYKSWSGLQHYNKKYPNNKLVADFEADIKALVDKDNATAESTELPLFTEYYLIELNKLI